MLHRRLPSEPRGASMESMNMWLQWILALFFRSKRGPKLDLTAVSRIGFRVWPTDVDLLMHMNNGRYLSYMDLGRVDLIERTGVQAKLSVEGIYAVVAAQTITYRKSLNLFQRFTIESKLLGADERSVYLEQRFTVRGQVYARAVVRGRFIRKGAGPVMVSEISEITGNDWRQYELPPEILAWSEGFRLPASKADVPSIW